MPNPEFYPQDFNPKPRMPADYCDMAKLLIKAAEMLDADEKLPTRQRVVTDLKVSDSLAAWLEYKASVLDQHYRVWENEEKRSPGSVISQMGGAAVVTERQYSHALAVAREVIRIHEKPTVKPLSFKDKVRSLFLGSIGRSGQSS